MQVHNINQLDTITTPDSNVQVNPASFSNYMQTTTTLDDIFQRASDAHQVPVNLLKAIGKAESNFDPTVTSRSGAQGVMQLMPKTASYLGVTDAYDPEQNIMGGAKYMAQLLTKYEGNITLALAAYNAGSGNVAKYGGVPPFKETQNYVVKVTQYMNEGVSDPKTYAPISTTPSTTFTPNTATTLIPTEEGNTTNFIEQIFSYDDYLTFLNLYFDSIMSNGSKSEETNPKEQKTQIADAPYYDLQHIKYNNSIMNLLKKPSI